jgi:Ca2+-binding RTX toxin-like protein
LNQAYLKLAGYITTSNGSKLDGVGGSIWHFINAAANINKDGNDMATVTREYSAFQSAVRRGVDFDNSLYLAVQVASDDIAIAILDQVIDDSIAGKGLPSMSKIEEKDANPASRKLFAGDPGGWVGSPMFIFFGHDRAFKDYITDSIVNPITDPVNANGGSRGGYDMFAMVAATLFAVSKVATSQVSNPLQTLRDLVATIAGNDLGYVDKVTILTSAVAEFDASLKKLYGDEATIIKLGAAGILGILAAANDSSLVNKAGIILGTNKTGANEGDTITGSDLNDFIHAGRGDDTVLGGNGNDLIDGGDGEDFIDYSASAIPVRFTLKYLDALKTRYGIEAAKDSSVPSGLTGTDLLFNFEKFRGSMFGDIVAIKGLIADIPQKTSPTFPGLPKFLLDLFGNDATPRPLGRSMLPVSPQFGGDSIDVSGGGRAESTAADGQKVQSQGVVIDLQNADKQFAADEKGILPTKLGLEGRFPIAGLSKQLEFYNLVYAEINKATDLTGYATNERLNLKNVESATGTAYNDLLIGADTVYKWVQPEPPAPTAEVPNPPMPPLKRVVDTSFGGYDLTGGKGDDTIIIYKGGSDPAGGKDQVVFHKIDGGEGRDRIQGPHHWKDHRSFHNRRRRGRRRNLCSWQRR